MADNIDAAFAALGARGEAIFARLSRYLCNFFHPCTRSPNKITN